MSHYTCLVIGPNPEEQLAPFHEYESTGVRDEHVEFVEISDEKLKAIEEDYSRDHRDGKTLEEFIRSVWGYTQNDGKWGHWTNPNAKWDWYVLGGRWRDFFRLRNGGCASQALKRDIDFQGARAAAEQEAGQEYDRARQIIEAHGEGFREHDELLEEGKRNGTSEADVWDLYRKQPLLNHWEDFWWTTPKDFAVDRETYIRQAANRACGTFSFLLNGEWHERGEMGWWGSVRKARDEDEWNDLFWRTIDGLPDDTLLSLYDLHI